MVLHAAYVSRGVIGTAMVWSLVVAVVLGYNERLLGVVGSLIVFVAVVFPMIFAGFESSAKALRTIDRVLPWAVLFGGTATSLSAPEATCVIAVVYGASPVALLLRLAHNDQSISEHSWARECALPVVFGGIAHLVSIILAHQGLLYESTVSGVSLWVLQIAAMYAQVWAGLVWVVTLSTLYGSLRADVDHAVSVLQACGAMDVSAANSRMKMWSGGNLYRSTERVVASMQQLSIQRNGRTGGDGKFGMMTPTMSGVFNPFMATMDGDTDNSGESVATSTSNSINEETAASMKKAFQPTALRTAIVIRVAVKTAMAKNIFVSDIMRACVDIIGSQRGVVLPTTVGSDCVACWGLSPNDGLAGAAPALEAAVRLHEQLTPHGHSEDEYSLHVTVCQGQVQVIGPLSSPVRVWGKAINLSSALLAVARHSSCGVVVDSEIRSQRGDRMNMRPMEIVDVRPFRTHPGSATEDLNELVYEYCQGPTVGPGYSEVFACIERKDLFEASKKLERYLGDAPGDTIAQEILMRILQAQRDGQLSDVARKLYHVWDSVDV